LRSIDSTGRKLLDQHLEIIDAIQASDSNRGERAARAQLDFVEQSIHLSRELQRRERRARMRLNLRK
jgi:GntR family transcriptional repressor for pyruvate dehydrogenase complex